MKKIIIFLSILSITVTCFSQSAFDKALKSISNDLAGKLKLQDRKKIVVLYITDINKTITIAGKYLADNISYNLVNDTMFKVFERENISNIAEAQKIIDEGYINAENSKKLGKLLSVNTIIVGNYTVLSNTIKLSLKALSSDNGSTIAASMLNLPLNADAGALLGIKIFSTGENASKDSNCEEKKTGDFCFKNNISKNLIVNFWNDGQSYTKNLIVNANETQCLFDIPIGTLNYYIKEYLGYNVVESGVTINAPPKYSANGQVYVEQCKSKTFTIK